jgi:hypothetical protein
MSQFFIATTSGNLPPDVPLQFTTDNGTAVPSGNILDVRGIDVTDNNENGIQVEGGAVQTGASNRLQVQLTNRITGTAQTTDGATPVTLSTFSLGATPGTYLFTTKIIAYNTTDGLGAGYSVASTVRTNGITATSIGANTAFSDEEGVMSGVAVIQGVSGNSDVITVTGITGKTINWRVLTDYIFVS